MKETDWRKTLEVIVKGLVAVVVGLAGLYILGWVLSLLGGILLGFAGIIVALLRWLVPVAIVVGIVYFAVTQLQSKTISASSKPAPVDVEAMGKAVQVPVVEPVQVPVVEPVQVPVVEPVQVPVVEPVQVPVVEPVQAPVVEPVQAPVAGVESVTPEITEAQLETKGDDLTQTATDELETKTDVKAKKLGKKPSDEKEA